MCLVIHELICFYLECWLPAFPRPRVLYMAISPFRGFFFRLTARRPFIAVRIICFRAEVTVTHLYMQKKDMKVKFYFETWPLWGIYRKYPKKKGKKNDILSPSPQWTIYEETYSYSASPVRVRGALRLWILCVSERCIFLNQFTKLPCIFDKNSSRYANGLAFGLAYRLYLNDVLQRRERKKALEGSFIMLRITGMAICCHICKVCVGGVSV